MNNHHKHILIIDDDVEIGSLLSSYLQKQGFLTNHINHTDDAKILLNFFYF